MILDSIITSNNILRRIVGSRERIHKRGLLNFKHSPRVTGANDGILEVRFPVAFVFYHYKDFEWMVDKFEQRALCIKTQVFYL